MVLSFVPVLSAVDLQLFSMGVGEVVNSVWVVFAYVFAAI